MPRLFPTVALTLAVAASACAGATRAGGPVYTPPTANADDAARNTQTAPSGPTQINASQRGVIPAGQEIDVRLNTALSSESARPEQRFEATTVVDVMQDNQLLIPAGSVVRGVVSAVKPAGRVERTGSITLSFDQVQIRGRDVPIRGMATQVFESGGIREEAGTAGVGAGVGGIIGGILGGVKGAVLGAVIGAGGAIAATDGKDIELPAGTIVRVRFDSPARVN
jgi:hypothetical protein